MKRFLLIPFGFINFWFSLTFATDRLTNLQEDESLRKAFINQQFSQKMEKFIKKEGNTPIYPNHFTQYPWLMDEFFKILEAHKDKIHTLKTQISYPSFYPSHRLNHLTPFLLRLQKVSHNIKVFETSHLEIGEIKPLALALKTMSNLHTLHLDNWRGDYETLKKSYHNDIKDLWATIATLPNIHTLLVRTNWRSSRNPDYAAIQNCLTKNKGIIAIKIFDLVPTIDIVEYHPELKKLRSITEENAKRLHSSKT